MASNGAHCLADRARRWRHAAAMLQSACSPTTCFPDGAFARFSNRERRYNPMSYHNGSVWPHDNAMAALGLARCRRLRWRGQNPDGLFDACAQLNTSSLPELFCGFPREPSLGPVPYPVACYPQAWSAASVFMFLQAMLGMRVLGFERRVVFDTHLIPSWWIGSASTG